MSERWKRERQLTSVYLSYLWIVHIWAYYQTIIHRPTVRQTVNISNVYFSANQNRKSWFNYPITDNRALLIHRSICSPMSPLHIEYTLHMKIMEEAIQSTKILLVPPKLRKIHFPLLCIAPCKVIALCLLCLIFCIISLLLSFIFLSIVISLPHESNTEKKPWINVQNRYKNEVMRLRATTFAIVKLEEQ